MSTIGHEAVEYAVKTSWLFGTRIVMRRAVAFGDGGQWGWSRWRRPNRSEQIAIQLHMAEKTRWH